ncbi:MAG TPA: hypothetical protein VG148_10400 [Pyrinomonadaceae bacterium]|nr:hypothetical protein [Pyrinomonadaceae bacterium]
MASPSLDQVVAAMMDTLDDFFPPAPAGPPPPGVSLVSVTEKQVGLGGLRGLETRSPFSTSLLRGVRLDAVVRFQVWGDTPAAADDLMTQQHALLLAAKEQLKVAGFLTVAAQSTSLVNFVGALNFWRKFADYHVLYEFAFQDSGDAGGLIARIPVGIDSVYNEQTVVTDETVRWGDVEAPDLEVRAGVARPFRVRALYVLASLPAGWDGDGVTVSSSVGGVPQQRGFASVRDFFNALTPEPGTVELGGAVFSAGRLAFPNADFPAPILLARGGDLFRVVYAAPPLNHADAVVYLRALG